MNYPSTDTNAPRRCLRFGQRDDGRIGLADLASGDEIAVMSIREAKLLNETLGRYLDELSARQQHSPRESKSYKGGQIVSDPLPAVGETRGKQDTQDPRAAIYRAHGGGTAW